VEFYANFSSKALKYLLTKSGKPLGSSEFWRSDPGFGIKLLMVQDSSGK
jgi:hypothetical protein